MHHTTDKGDLGVARVTADLIEQGFEVFAPVSASSPVDLLVLKDGKAITVQVKYRATDPDGRIEAKIGRASITAAKFRTRPLKPEEVVDCFAFVSEETRECYYVDVRGKTAGVVGLRIRKSKYKPHGKPLSQLRQFPF